MYSKCYWGLSYTSCGKVSWMSVFRRLRKCGEKKIRKIGRWSPRSRYARAGHHNYCFIGNLIWVTENLSHTHFYIGILFVCIWLCLFLYRVITYLMTDVIQSASHRYHFYIWYLWCECYRCLWRHEPAGAVCMRRRSEGVTLVRD